MKAKNSEKYLPQMQREYDYWMDEGNVEKGDFTSYRRVVHLPDGVLLNRYWDDKSTPRPESYTKILSWQKKLRKASSRLKI